MSRLLVGVFFKAAERNDFAIDRLERGEHRVELPDVFLLLAVVFAAEVLIVLGLESCCLDSLFVAAGAKVIIGEIKSDSDYPRRKRRSELEL